MLYHEIYGGYFRAVEEILRLALQGPVSTADIVRLCDQYASGESAQNIMPALLKGNWPLLTADRRAVVEYVPDLPLTLLERRWLRAISLDPRMQLFDLDFSFLGDVEPLFRPEDVLCFDGGQAGDDYFKPAYRANFRLMLRAIAEGREVRMTYANRRQIRRTDTCTPLRMEYSQKDDCFRVICATEKGVVVRNMSGVEACELGEKHQAPLPDPDSRERRQVVLEIRDERNTLERASLHFNHLQKEVEREGDRRYRMTLWYDLSDEPEMVIRVLQFGPMVRVLEPASFAKTIRERIDAQLAMLNNWESAGQ